MSAARTARRRRKQAAQGYMHMAPQRRPRYRHAKRGSIADAIAWERRQAAKLAKLSGKKKKG